MACWASLELQACSVEPDMYKVLGTSQSDSTTFTYSCHGYADIITLGGAKRCTGARQQSIETLSDCNMSKLQQVPGTASSQVARHGKYLVQRAGNNNVTQVHDCIFLRWYTHERCVPHT